MNPQRIANLVLIFSDVVLALVVGGRSWSGLPGVPAGSPGFSPPTRSPASSRRGVGGATGDPGAVPGLWPQRGGRAAPPELRDARGPHHSLHVLRLASRSGRVPLRAHRWVFGTSDRCSARAAVGEVEPQESKALGELDDHE